MIIHQTLHGYYKGHGLLASSFQVPPSDDSALMSILSDWTGYRSKDASRDYYLTTYPLPDGERYAIAMSWYADDVDRPGCVWTQTLLLNINELEKDTDLRQLVSLFKRPIGEDYSYYSTPIEFNNTETVSSDEVFKSIDRVTLLFLFTFVISGNKGLSLYLDLSQDTAIQLILLYLQYLPKEILRRSSFSSGSESPRRIGDSDFTLQFVTGGRCIAISSAPWKEKISEEDFNGSIRYIFDEAERGNVELAKLIRIFSVDVGIDVDKFMSVVSIMKIFDETLKGINPRGTYTDVLKIISKTFPNPSDGKLLKLNFLGSNITKLFCSERETLFAVASSEETNAFDNETNQLLLRTANLLKDDYNQFLVLVSDISSLSSPNKFGISILRLAISRLAKEDLNVIIEKNWEVMQAIIGTDEFYFKSGYWIDLSREHFNLIQLVYSTNDFTGFEHWNELLDKYLADECLTNDKLCTQIVRQADNGVRKVLDVANSKTEFVCPFFLTECEKYPADVLRWLKVQSTINERIARFVVFRIAPDSKYTRVSGSALWLPLLNIGNIFEMQYYFFLYVLGHNWVDDNALQYLRESFYPIYRQLEENKVTDKDWSKLRRYADESSVIPSWDKCKMFRKGLVKYLKRAKYDLDCLNNFTPDENLNRKILKSLSK